MTNERKHQIETIAIELYRAYRVPRAAKGQIDRDYTELPAHHKESLRAQAEWCYEKGVRV